MVSFQETTDDKLFLPEPAFLELLQALFSEGLSLRFKAAGFSMSPFIRHGDVITLIPLAGTPPGLGEVVAFAPPQGQKLIVHRVIGRRAGSYLLKGDNRPTPDGLISAAYILGRVSRVERNGQQVGFGLGPERLVIALLARRGAVAPQATSWLATSWLTTSWLTTSWLRPWAKKLLSPQKEAGQKEAEHQRAGGQAGHSGDGFAGDVPLECSECDLPILATSPFDQQNAPKHPPNSG